MKNKSDGDTRNFTPIRFALLCTAILLSMA
ncbi:hypothetical protein ACV2BM_09015, partial [Salmonella enterica subsp. enterica serovar Adelaide]